MSERELAAALADRDELFDQLANLVGDAERQSYFAARPYLVGKILVEELCREANRQVGIRPEKALELATTARFLVDLLPEDPSQRALATRAAANAHHFSGHFLLAQDHYDEALLIFERHGDALGAAITRSSALTNLAYLGSFERVFAWEAQARQTFEELHDLRRLAILDNNLANILTRQDRWQEAAERYQAAHREFVRLGLAEDAAICLRNIASCHVHLQRFDQAFEVYQSSRTYCHEHGLDQLLVEVDYNIAYLFFLRGEYSEAIARFEQAKEASRRNTDSYHLALCDLDLSEIYLELNLVEDAAALAGDAYELFQQLKMAYESAKALTNRAIAAGRSGSTAAALGGLTKARQIFVGEQNQLWPALLDFYAAVILGRLGRSEEALTLGRRAQEVFAASAVVHRELMCGVLVAYLELELGKVETALAEATTCLGRLAAAGLPALEQQAERILARCEERRGRPRAAFDALSRALEGLERMRANLHGEDLKIAFFQDKRSLYEGLFFLSLHQATADCLERAWLYAEKAKSRSLLDLLAFGAYSLPARTARQEELVARVRTLREELHWSYRRLDTEWMRGDLAKVEPLREEASRLETELLRATRQVQAADRELGSLQAPSTVDLEAVRASLPPRAALLDFYFSRERIYVAIVGQGALEIVALGEVARVQDLFRRLQFQMGRFTSAAPAIPGSEQWIRKAIERHLHELHQLLVAPWLEKVAELEHLVLAPHDFLHHLPFQALTDAHGQSLIERFSLSYAPSAAIFQLCREKPPTGSSRVVVLGIADDRAPSIRQEAGAIAEIFPAAEVFLDAAADQQALAAANGSRFVHLATHGIFRRDHPMFSAIQLGGSRLSLFDLYSLRLDADLVVLSGCSTGLAAVLGADELVGLSRGLLFAGARSLLMTLWDVQDASTAEFMKLFYQNLAAGREPSMALREAMLTHKQAYNDVCFWAPFVLVGQP